MWKGDVVIINFVLKDPNLSQDSSFGAECPFWQITPSPIWELAQKIPIKNWHYCQVHEIMKACVPALTEYWSASFVTRVKRYKAGQWEMLQGAAIIRPGRPWLNCNVYNDLRNGNTQEGGLSVPHQMDGWMTRLMLLLGLRNLWWNIISLWTILDILVQYQCIILHQKIPSI